jgi:hypothetical protein
MHYFLSNAHNDIYQKSGYSVQRKIDWLFTVLSPAQEFFTCMETSPSPINGCRAFEQGGIFIMPHLLWHRARFFRSHPKDHPILLNRLLRHKGMWRIYSYPDPHGLMEPHGLHRQTNSWKHGFVERRFFFKRKFPSLSFVFVCLLFYVPLKNFSLITSEGLQNLGLYPCSSGPSSREGSLSCHTYCDSGLKFFRSHPKDRPI